jgi:lysosomal alpha-mannosidase
VSSVFRPAEQFAHPAVTKATNVFTSDNNLITSVQQTFDIPWISQTIRLSTTSPFIEFEWTIGPIDVDDQQGKEVITRFTTDIANNATWYTDSNGREFQTRIRNYRQTYHWNATEPTAGNYVSHSLFTHWSIGRLVACWCCVGCCSHLSFSVAVCCVSSL